MTYNPKIHHRRSIRLRGYDYSAAGVCFVTICIQGRESLLGEIVAGAMQLNAAGRAVAGWWMKLPEKFPGVAVDDYVVMPNHFHGIIHVGAASCGCPGFNATPCGCPGLCTHGGENGHPHGGAPTVGDVIDWFKTMTTNAYIRGVKENQWPPFPGRLWQRNYYERMIRNHDEWCAVREYILNNPANWDTDSDNPVWFP